MKILQNQSKPSKIQVYSGVCVYYHHAKNCFSETNYENQYSSHVLTPIFTGYSSVTAGLRETPMYLLEYSNLYFLTLPSLWRKKVAGMNCSSYHPGIVFDVTFLDALENLGTLWRNFLIFIELLNLLWGFPYIRFSVIIK